LPRTPKRVVYAFDDNHQIIADIEDAVARNTNASSAVVRSEIDEDEAINVVKRYRKSNAAPLFIIDLKIRDSSSGLRILNAIRRKPSLRYAPVIVVSSSNDQNSINASYEGGANGYVVKHDDPDEFVKLLDSLMQFWASAELHRAPRRA